MDNLHRDMDIATWAATDIEFRLSDEFAAWMKDDAHCALFKDIMNAREALLNMGGAKCPDAEKVLRRIVPVVPHATRPLGKQTFLRWAGIAALLAVVLSVGIMAFQHFSKETELSPVAILPASHAKQQVVLSVGDSVDIVVASSDAKQLSEAGVRVSDAGITYPTEEETAAVSQHTLTTPRGKTFRIALEDGSVVWLNSESRLSYPNHFVGTERRVSIEGEAYFQVAKDESKPFIVQAGAMETRVLGTEFNVCSHTDGEQSVALLKGSVQVSSANGRYEQVLTPGQEATIDPSTHAIETKTVDVMECTAWKDHLFCFRNVELFDIMKEIGHWYNVDVIFTSAESMHYHFNFWADREETLENTVHLLNEVGKVKAEIKDGRLVIY